MKYKKKKKNNKQKEVKSDSKRMTNLMVLMSFAVALGIFGLMLDAALDHRDLHYAEDAPKQYKMEIRELEEIVSRDPNSF